MTVSRLHSPPNHQYSEFGVRVWPEVLPALGIDPTALRPCPSPLPAGLIVRAALSAEGKPRKIIGKGDGSAMSTAMQANGSNGHASQTPPEPEGDPNFPF